MKQTVALERSNHPRDSLVEGVSIFETPRAWIGDLSFHARFLRWITPQKIVLGQVIQNCDELSHTRNQCHFLFLATFEQMLVACLDARVVTCGNQRRHVDHFANIRSTSDRPSLATLGTRVLVDRCHANELSDLPSVESVSYTHLTLPTTPYV